MDSAKTTLSFLQIAYLFRLFWPFRVAAKAPLNLYHIGQSNLLNGFLFQEIIEDYLSLAL